MVLYIIIDVSFTLQFQNFVIDVKPPQLPNELIHSSPAAYSNPSGYQDSKCVSANALKMRRYRQRLKNERREDYQKHLKKECERQKLVREKERLARAHCKNKLIMDREKWRIRNYKYRKLKKDQSKEMCHAQNCDWNNCDFDQFDHNQV